MAPHKGFALEVTLDIHNVTCPGVWLCPIGEVSLQVYLMNSTIKTPYMKPSFPIKCNEQYVFNKNFYSQRTLSDLQTVLSKEILYIELIQWDSFENGNVLATFQTSLRELLYPSIRDGVNIGTDVDLLMDPVKNFPGIIAPKIEVSTISKIEEIVNAETENQCDNNTIYHKVITSYKNPKKRNCHQRRVCHSSSYNNVNLRSESKRLSKRPPFVVRHCNEDSILRQPGFTSDKTNSSLNKSKDNNQKETLCNNDDPFQMRRSFFSQKECRVPNEKNKRRRKTEQAWCEENESKFQNNMLCCCNNQHANSNCHVCHQYAKYFNYNLQGSRSHGGYDKLQKCGSLNKSLSDFHINASNTSFDNYNNQCDICKSAQLPQTKVTLANKIHERLKETLNTARNYGVLRGCDSDTDVLTSDAEDLKDCGDLCYCSHIAKNCSKTEFLENLDRLYQRFRRSLGPKENI